MRVAVWGVLVSTALAIAIAGACLQRTPAFAQNPLSRQAERFVPSGELIALTSEADEGRQQVTLIDPKTRVMSVYHIERSTGKITLKSVRNVHWDLLMEEFNGTSPSPGEIRALLEQR